MAVRQVTVPVPAPPVAEVMLLETDRTGHPVTVPEAVQIFEPPEVLFKGMSTIEAPELPVWEIDKVEVGLVPAPRAQDRLQISRVETDPFQYRPIQLLVGQLKLAPEVAALSWYCDMLPLANKPIELPELPWPIPKAAPESPCPLEVDPFASVYTFWAMSPERKSTSLVPATSTATEDNPAFHIIPEFVLAVNA